jgi:hypothetical protein
MSPKDPCVRGLVPSMALLGDGRNIKRWSLLGGVPNTEGRPLRRQWDPSPFLFFSFALGLEMNQFVQSHVPATICFLSSSKSNWVNQSLTESSKTMSPNRPFLSLLSQLIISSVCNSNGKLVFCACITFTMSTMSIALSETAFTENVIT